MNERIKELAQNAGLISHFNAAPHRPDIEKFAELLLQECLLAISKTPKLFTEEEVAVMVKCHDQVEKHFGVEDK